MSSGQRIIAEEAAVLADTLGRAVLEKDLGFAFAIWPKLQRRMSALQDLAPETAERGFQVDQRLLRGGTQG